MRGTRTIATPPPGRAVVVTGASSGLGRECALDLEDRGFHVLAGVRREEDGEKLVAESLHGRLRYALVDVTDDASVTACAERCEREYGGLWGLVNNAGICVSAPLECVSTEQLRRQFDTNVVGQLSMIRAHLPLLRRSRGRIVNVTSGLGRIAVPYLGAYAMAQFAKEAMSDALRREVASSGVRVSVVRPGAILTPIWGKVAQVGGEVLRGAPPGVAEIYRASFEAFLEANAQQAVESGTTPEQFAQAVARALTDAAPRTRYPVGADVRRFELLSRVLPDALLDRRFRGMTPAPAESVAHPAAAG
ncbi:SDR family oxidoreductase [Marinactinospora thermotolerans]|uniref:NADP-dependent 3-hydroxy acid dehydrogenase YdfG n=1 Tax=Marinactinospora thermotolerans DSM 45154 TaxID=1122192 RepID=A0A1T4R2Y2_9ACTN|nr:SDR family oxidoreductase [Marinactinospora thermotolerans]SKA10185.1 NADP-dependent 3-hydroxy acid dehydrogenase YdfG [Marinactinospora thermotolerans DSM 45154]